MAPEKARRRLASINPATGELLREYEPNSAQELESKLVRAQAAFELYRRTSFAERAGMMTRGAELLERDKHLLAKTMTLEMGKPIRASVKEVEKCASGCRFYADNAARFLADEEVTASDGRTCVRFQPLGVVLAIMPWNFPLWQVFRFAAPALMAGNVALLKHASNVPQCALEIERIFQRAGFPPGVFQTLLIGSEQVRSVIEDPRVSAVTLTGSVEAGSSVASVAGRQIKRTVLELGGSDPFVVMPSANLDQAVDTAVQARIVNNGQSCIAAKRFIVHRKIAAEFERQFTSRMSELKVGDPMNEETDIGPLATPDVLASLEKQVNETVRMGGRLLLGGKRLTRPGNFFSPTVLTEIPRGSPAYNDELFGPVASLFCAEDIEEAIRIANDTCFGLGSCIWTNDESERATFIENIQSGLAFVNGMVVSDPRLPFGGIKQSGYGRELGAYGIREFVNTKTIVIKEAGQSETRTE
jgi:succinate-semialdehyde dehydrogenase/glutarate-semialdehyde dehydrogenase